MNDDSKIYEYSLGIYLVYFSTLIIGIIGLYLGFFFNSLPVIIFGVCIQATSIIILIQLKRTSPLKTSCDLIIIRRNPLFKSIKIYIKNIIKMNRHKYYRAIVITFKNDKNEINEEYLILTLLKERDQLIFLKFVELFNNN